MALKGHTEEVISANFSNKDGSQVVTASDDETVRIYNASGNEICVLKGHTKNVWHAVFSPNDKYVLTSSADKSVRLWFLDLADSKEVVKLGGHEKWSMCGRFSSDGLKVYQKSTSGTQPRRPEGRYSCSMIHSFLK